MVTIYPWPLFQGQMRVAKVNIAYNLLIIAPRGLVCETSELENNSNYRLGILWCGQI